MTINENDLETRLEELEQRYTENLEQRLAAVEERLDKLSVKATKKAKSEFTSAMKLAEAKQIFLDSRPHDRTDPFTDWELVFWASYLLSKTSRREKLDNVAEVAKRAVKIKGLVEHFSRQYYEANVPNVSGEDADIWARNKVKLFLEMVLLQYPKAGDKPMVFYMAVSDWAVNTFGSKLASWQQVSKFEDKPPSDND